VTAVLVSHRLGSARLCDRVLVLEGGRLVEQGRHDELVAAGGPYARLWAVQSQWYR
jgi:ABC-type multidrug transport system fused ATPase/permease subunit